MYIPYTSWQSQYYKMLKLDNISCKSATFLFNLEMNSTKRMKKIHCCCWSEHSLLACSEFLKKGEARQKNEIHARSHSPFWATLCHLRLPNSDFFCGRNTFFFGSRHCSAVLFLQVHKKCTNLGCSLLYILTLGTYSKFTRKNDFLAPGVCFPQPCSSAGRRFAASRSRSQNYRRIVSFPQQKNRWNAL